MRALTNLALLGSVSLVAACGSSGNTGPQMYRKDLGVATAHDLEQKILKTFQRYRFQIERQEVASENAFLIESRWTGRYPFRDELEFGVAEATTRFTIRARVRRQGGGGTVNLLSAVFTAENMVRKVDSTEWERGFMTPMFKKYVDEIADYLKLELAQGIRVF